MAARASLLGDEGQSAPRTGRRRFGTPDVARAGDDLSRPKTALSAHDQRVRERAIARTGGLTVVHDDLGSALPENREHFGYADGFAQPDIEGAGLPSHPGDGAPLGGGTGGRSAPASSSSATPTRRACCPPRPRPTSSPPTARSSSTESSIRTSPPSAASSRRRRRSIPAARSCSRPRSSGAGATARRSTSRPSIPTRRIVADADRNNAFSYADRPRRAALPGRRPRPPRQPARQPALRRQAGQPPPPDPARHPVRRPAAAEGASDDGEDRGVIFMCLQASIARQFEFIQCQWLNGGNAFTPRRGPGRPSSGPRTGRAAQDDRAGQPAVLRRTVVAAWSPCGAASTSSCPGINGLHYLAALGGY